MIPPFKPDEPEEPDDPEVPDEPLDPDVPDDPEEPDVPDDPDEPEEPLDPDVPEEPDDPDVPLDPDEPLVPDEPEEPDVPDEPDEPLDPDEPESPYAANSTEQLSKADVATSILPERFVTVTVYTFEDGPDTAVTFITENEFELPVASRNVTTPIPVVELPVSSQLSIQPSTSSPLLFSLLIVKVVGPSPGILNDAPTPPCPGDNVLPL